jgi:hypothetical protein
MVSLNNSIELNNKEIQKLSKKVDRGQLTLILSVVGVLIAFWGVQQYNLSKSLDNKSEYIDLQVKYIHDVIYSQPKLPEINLEPQSTIPNNDLNTQSMPPNDNLNPQSKAADNNLNAQLKTSNE